MPIRILIPSRLCDRPYSGFLCFYHQKFGGPNRSFPCFSVTGVAGGALIGTGLGASAGIAAFATIGAGGGLLSAQAGYSIASGKDCQSDEMLVAATVGAVSGAISGALGAPTSVNPLSGTPAAYAVQATTNFVAGAAQYIGTQFVNGEKVNLRDAAIVGGANYLMAGFTDGLTINGSFAGRMVDKFGMRFVRENMKTQFMKAAMFDALSEGTTSIIVETIANNFPVLDHLVDKVIPE